MIRDRDLHSMYLNFSCVAILVTTGRNSFDLGSPTTASNKSFSFKNVCIMLSTGVTLKKCVKTLSYSSFFTPQQL